MRLQTKNIGLLIVLVGLLLIPSPLTAQQQKKAGKKKAVTGSPKQLAVDVVMTNDGRRLHGVLTSNNDSGATLAIERSWLKNRLPEFYRTHLADEVINFEKKNQLLVDRIEAWIQERADESDLVFFLENERDSAKAKLGNPDVESHRFTMVKIPKSDIRKVYQQSDEHRQIAMVAFGENLADVADRSAVKLQKELRTKGVELTKQFDFRSEITSPAESGRSWAVRKALVEYDVLQRVDYQGVDGAFFESGEEMNVAGLLKAMMAGGGSGSQLQQIGEMLDIPEFTRNKKSKSARDKDNWWKKTAAKVAKKGARCFTITRMDNNILSDDVNIQVALIAKDDKDNWVRVGTFSGNAKGSKQDAADIAGLKDDPQVKKALEMFGGLGLVDEKTIRKAMLRGLATQKAMQSAQSEFGEFLLLHTDRLDGMELKLEK